MASRLMKRGAKAFGIDLKHINVRIYPQNTGTPVWESEGGVAGVVWTATGKFTITLDDAYYKLRTFQTTYRDERDNSDLYAQPGPVTGEGAGTPITLVVKLKTGSANTDTAAGAGAKDRCIYVDLEFEDVAA
jgi:hypothetical protein